MPAPKTFDLNQFLATRTDAVNAALDKFLPSEKTRPADDSQGHALLALCRRQADAPGVVSCSGGSLRRQ